MILAFQRCVFFPMNIFKNSKHSANVQMFLCSMCNRLKNEYKLYYMIVNIKKCILFFKKIMKCLNKITILLLFKSKIGYQQINSQQMLL